jgi:hypothetical protein
MNWTVGVGMIVLSALWAAGARADQAACDKILEANRKTGSNGGKMKATGYPFAGATADIYGTGDHTCSHVRDETVEGQAAEVYREQYKAKAGSTDATIWISKSTGHVLREEQDGEVPGKGKGHISYTWASTGGAPRPGAADSTGGATASAAIRRDGKLPMYPRGRNLNDIPASAVEKGVPMVLETSDSVATVDAWYKSNAGKPCARSTADQGIKYACPGGSIMIYPHDGKTQIAFVPAIPTS